MKFLTVILFSTWKFAATFPVALYMMRMSFLETLLFTNLGGILGTLCSVYLSDWLIKLWNAYWPGKLKLQRKDKKVFTKKNRRFVKIRQKYGLLGIIALSPVILSIPVGSFLTVRYYGIKRSNILGLITGQLIWSVIYVVIYTQAQAALI